MNALVPINRSEVSVVSMLEHAKQWLATAVETTGPAEIAAAKAQIATAETYTRELNLSKEIQLDATEMVRRAEYALGKAIRKGQAEGTILGRGQVVQSYDRHSGDRSVTANSTKARPSDFASTHELGGSDQTPGIYTIADGVDSGQFDAAIDAAKAEGNLSRANVVRKVRGEVTASTRPAERSYQEAELVNAFSSIIRRSLTPKNIATLSPAARKKLIQVLETALSSLKGDNQ